MNKHFGVCKKTKKIKIGKNKDSLNSTRYQAKLPKILSKRNSIQMFDDEKPIDYDALLIGEEIKMEKKEVKRREKRENSIIDSPMKHEKSFAQKPLNHSHDIEALNTILESCREGQDIV